MATDWARWVTPSSEEAAPRRAAAFLPPLPVLHVLPYPGVGGTEIATIRLVRGLAAYGVDSTLMTLRPNGAQRDWLVRTGVSFEELPSTPTPSVRYLPRFLDDSWTLARSLRQRRFELIHCADVTAALFVSAAAMMAGIPVLAHVRARHGVLSWRDKACLRPVTHYAFVSAAARHEFGMRIPDSRATIVGDAVDTVPRLPSAERTARAIALRQSLGMPPDAAVVAMFARLSPQKDFGTLAAATARLRSRHPALRVLIVGEHERDEAARTEYARVQARVHAEGVSEIFTFAGFRADAREIMQLVDVVVLCTHTEGLPLVPIEALLAGAPVVATAVGGVPEVITHGVTGLTHAHQDADGLAAALGRLLSEPDYARSLAAAGYADALLRFSPDRLNGALATLYARLAGRV